MDVCYGQQHDFDFETRNDVTIDEYVDMIRLKTAVLLGCALSLGAKVAGADEIEINHLQKFGENVGIAFQLQDDLLDTFGDQATFGKRIGGDIIQNKKTYLYLKAIELADENQKKELATLYSSHPDDEEDKIERVKSIFDKLNVKEYASQMMDAYNHLGLSHLEALKVDEENRKPLKELCELLMNRKS
jgi:geranylgeranyl diphosphate synthase type II